MKGKFPAPETIEGLNPKSAVALQRQLAGRVRLEARKGWRVRTVGGVDAAFPDAGRVTRAAVAVLSYPKLQPIEDRFVERPTRFPYVPGLLSFRELPAILEALDALDTVPDLVLCDGQGTAHPRRFGIACHLGVITGLPCIGVGKSRLCGEAAEPGIDKGAVVALVEKGERIGSVVRTRTGVRPLYVSPGHRIGHREAVNWVLATTGRFRLPEPVRAADRLSRRPGAPGSRQHP